MFVGRVQGHVAGGDSARPSLRARGRRSMMRDCEPRPNPTGMIRAMRPAYQKYDVSVRPSAIDGQGVFAAEPIAAHRKIGEIRGESLSVEDARIRATRHERIM